VRSAAIVGTGLIGGSFGLALRKAGFQGSIVGVSSERSIAEALTHGAIDRGATLEEACAGADLIFLSQPISGILETLRKLNPLVRRGTLVTDAGSTKKEIVEEAARSLTRCVFLGGHPMAGKESRGAASADADLFRDRPWVLTADLDHPVARVLRKWIALFGAREVILDAAAHDELVAWSSHLPQLASTALASVLEDRAGDVARVAGPGLFDMTRLAMSSYDLWRDILGTNGEAVRVALDAYIGKLQHLRDDYEAEFARGSEFARTVRVTRETKD
jgi:prephenate dehydrogenase